MRKVEGKANAPYWLLKCAFSHLKTEVTEHNSYRSTSFLLFEKVLWLTFYQFVFDSFCARICANSSSQKQPAGQFILYLDCCTVPTWNRKLKTYCTNLEVFFPSLHHLHTLNLHKNHNKCKNNSQGIARLNQIKHYGMRIYPEIWSHFWLRYLPSSPAALVFWVICHPKPRQKWNPNRETLKTQNLHNCA